MEIEKIVKVHLDDMEYKKLDKYLSPFIGGTFINDLQISMDEYDFKYNVIKIVILKYQHRDHNNGEYVDKTTILDLETFKQIIGESND